MAAQISGTASVSNMDLYNGPVQATLRAANGTDGRRDRVHFQSSCELVANNGAARVTLSDGISPSQ